LVKFIDLLERLVMPDFDAIIIGTGQAGPSLAFRLAGAGMKAAVVERHLVGEICGFDQGADFRHPPKFGDAQTGDSGVTIVVDQPARLGELGGGALSVAFESIGGGEARSNVW
jgi:hypothetical protein